LIGTRIPDFARKGTGENLMESTEFFVGVDVSKAELEIGVIPLCSLTRNSQIGEIR